MSESDFKKLLNPLSRDYGRQKPFTAVNSADPVESMKQKQSLNELRATPVEFPPHLYIPKGAESLDIRRAADIAANTINPFLFMEFECPQGATAHFLSYAIYSDGNLANTQEFIPRVDGRRAMPFQGDPQDNFKINLGLAPDLSNNSLITCQLTLNPGEKVQWFLKNLNAVAIAMGVRMVGYIDRSMLRVQSRTGG